jgi:hypothetical protein
MTACHVFQNTNFDLFGYLPRSGIAGTYTNFISSFLGQLHSFLK